MLDYLVVSEQIYFSSIALFTKMLVAKLLTEVS